MSSFLEGSIPSVNARTFVGTKTHDSVYERG
jgi:hypothetical protein